MERITLLFCLLVTTTALSQEAPFGLVIHGGAGTILRSNLDEQKETAIRETLNRALDAGWVILHNGGNSTEAAIAAVKILEDSPFFNAGKGAVYTNTETHELDASIMEGKTLQAGAVSGVTNVKNPIELARLVMTDSPHVMLSGEGAESFAKEKKLELVPNDYFNTDYRYQQLQKAKEKSKKVSRKADPGLEKFGTVGAVVLDKHGNLTAATSTGGTTNKRYGRVGDSPIIGAGTYANNQSCAVSATGHGEYFIRYVVAYDICARMLYREETLEEAADYVVSTTLKEAGGSGGVIAIDVSGNVAMPFNTKGMYRGYRIGADDPVVGIYSED
ncbi:MAG: isoaspartyl peptidase/L-asparaginase [Pseudomonadota bacterium]